MASRTIPHVMPKFDAAGQLVSYGVMTHVVGTDSYTDPEGVTTIITTQVWYERAAADLPASFVTDLEAIFTKTKNNMDSEFPL
jgi:hypothetical protein